MVEIHKRWVKKSMLLWCLLPVSLHGCSLIETVDILISRSEHVESINWVTFVRSCPHRHWIAFLLWSLNWTMDAQIEAQRQGRQANVRHLQRHGEMKKPMKPIYKWNGLEWLPGLKRIGTDWMDWTKQSESPKFLTSSGFQIGWRNTTRESRERFHTRVTFVSIHFICVTPCVYILQFLFITISNM